MKRPLAFVVIAAFTVSAVLPAAAFAERDLFAPEQSPSAALTLQSLAARQGASAPVLRDEFAVQVLTPELPAFFAPIAGLLSTWPCSAQVNDGYGDRDGGFHYGMDIMCGYGTTLVAAAAGVIEVVEGDGGSWGSYVKIGHGNGVSTLYAHMVTGSQPVVVGQLVSAGEVIGLSGDTGNVTAPHVHFEVWVGGTRVDPRPWLP